MNFLMKKLVERQLKNAPPEQREMIMKLMEKDPKLFTDMSKKIKEKVKGGMDQQMASMSVLMENKERIQKIMKEN